MFDLAVIGLGPAGLEAVNYALKKGLTVVAFECANIGGTCLNLGCIPTKSILHDTSFFYKLKNNLDIKNFDFKIDNVLNWNEIIHRKDDIVAKFKKAINSSLEKNITLINGYAELWLDENKIVISCNDNIYNAKNIIIATGSYPLELPDIKFDHKFILSSDDMYSLKSLPKQVTIIGSGAVGLEWSQILSNMGVEVNIIEKESCLAPSFDLDIQKRVERILKSLKIKYFKNDYVVSLNDNEISLNSSVKLKSDVILCAVGRVKNLPEIKILGCSESFRINVIDGYKTEFDNLYISGDATGISMLAHSAGYQSRCIIDKILYNIEPKKTNMPSVIYLTPEIASIGCREQDIDNSYTVSKVLLSSITKSWCDGSVDGFIKLIVKDRKIKGAHLVCPNASDIISFLSLCIEKEISIDEISNMIFAHPSYSEIIQEAARNV